MNALLALLPAALCSRSAPAVPVMYAGYPDLIPPDWQAIEPRWDCQRCGGIWPAEILPGGFRCLHCGIETDLTHS